jgi:hypothetical protein
MALNLTRKYIRGRDLYDLVWYLADPRWPAPNLDFLVASLAQAGWPGSIPKADTWHTCCRSSELTQQRLSLPHWPAGSLPGKEDCLVGQ